MVTRFLTDELAVAQLKTLSSKTCFDIVTTLTFGEMNYTQLRDAIATANAGSANSALAKLVQSGLVIRRREGRNVLYSNDVVALGLLGEQIRSMGVRKESQ